MPIKDMRDRYRPQRLGKVRLGIKKKNKAGIEYPSATDYFVLPDIPGLKETYGEQPRLLDIIFFFDSIEKVFPHFHKWYSQRGLRCLGDGESVLYRTDGPKEKPAVTIRSANLQPEWKEFAREWEETYGLWNQCERSVTCAGIDCRMSDGKNCRPTGRLCFGVIGVPFLGYLELTVHQRALLGIAGQLEFALAIWGHLTGIPFKLRLVQETIQPNGKSRKVYTPILEVDPEWMMSNLPRLKGPEALLGAGKSGIIEEPYGAEEVEGLDFEGLEAEAIRETQEKENGTEEIVPDEWVEFWASIREMGIAPDKALKALEETGGEPGEALKRFAKKAATGRRPNTLERIRLEANSLCLAANVGEPYKDVSEVMGAIKEVCKVWPGFTFVTEKWLKQNEGAIIQALYEKVSNVEPPEVATDDDEALADDSWTPEEVIESES